MRLWLTGKIPLPLRTSPVSVSVPGCSLCRLSCLSVLMLRRFVSAAGASGPSSWPRRIRWHPPVRAATLLCWCLFRAFLLETVSSLVLPRGCANFPCIWRGQWPLLVGPKAPSREGFPSLGWPLAVPEKGESLPTSPIRFLSHSLTSTSLLHALVCCESREASEGILLCWAHRAGGCFACAWVLGCRCRFGIPLTLREPFRHPASGKLAVAQRNPTFPRHCAAVRFGMLRGQTRRGLGLTAPRLCRQLPGEIAPHLPELLQEVLRPLLLRHTSVCSRSSVSKLSH